MIRITILCVGKIKEKYWNMAIDEYTKRLGRYCSINIVEVADEKTPDRASEAEEQQIKTIEGRRILDKLDSGSYPVALAIDGKNLSSVELSEWIDGKATSGVGNITFIIGGSLGLSDEVIKACQYKLSFSKMTFPHQMMRVILSEQIYRAFRILNHEPYHK